MPAVLAAAAVAAGRRCASIVLHGQWQLLLHRRIVCRPLQAPSRLGAVARLECTRLLPGTWGGPLALNA